VAVAATPTAVVSAVVGLTVLVSSTVCACIVMARAKRVAAMTVLNDLSIFMVLFVDLLVSRIITFLMMAHGFLGEACFFLPMCSLSYAKVMQGE